MAGEIRPVTVTIANGTAVSSNFQLGPGEYILGVNPDGWTTADVGLEVAPDGSTFVPVVDGERGVSVTTDARIINVADNSFNLAGGAVQGFHGPMLCRLTSINAASNADVNQGAARSVVVFIGKTN